MPGGRLQQPEGGLQQPEGGRQGPEGGRQGPDGRLPAVPLRYTFSGIAVLRPALFGGLAPGARPLRDVLFPAARRGALLGEVYDGLWRDVGTPQRLEDVRALLAARRPRTSGAGAG